MLQKPHTNNSKLCCILFGIKCYLLFAEEKKNSCFFHYFYLIKNKYAKNICFQIQMKKEQLACLKPFKLQIFFITIFFLVYLFILLQKMHVTFHLQKFFQFFCSTVFRALMQTIVMHIIQLPLKYISLQNINC